MRNVYLKLLVLNEDHPVRRMYNESKTDFEVVLTRETKAAKMIAIILPQYYSASLGSNSDSMSCAPV